MIRQTVYVEGDIRLNGRLWLFQENQQTLALPPLSANSSGVNHGLMSQVEPVKSGMWIDLPAQRRSFGDVGCSWWGPVQKWQWALQTTPTLEGRPGCHLPFGQSDNEEMNSKVVKTLELSLIEYDWDFHVGSISNQGRPKSLYNLGLYSLSGCRKISV